MPGKPYKMTKAVIAPRGFVGMHHLRRPDFFGYIRISQLANTI
jgi:hypothetical protein